MNSIRDQVAALDTNEFIFALRRAASHPACEILLFDRLNEFQIYIPLQILLELQCNLSRNEMHDLFLILTKAKAVTWDYMPAPIALVRQGESRGAKKGDAVITAHLESANVRYLISENRHFLAELPNLPFEVLTSAEALQGLD